MIKIYEVTLPIFTVSEANRSEHWSKKKKRTDLQKRWIKLMFNPPATSILPCLIKLTRIGKKSLEDDNLPTSMKYIRDTIADKLIPGLRPGMADGDPRISWQYAQEVTKGDYAVKVEVLVGEGCF